MNYESITPLISKRNRVYLARGNGLPMVVVKDFLKSSDAYDNELRVSRLLREGGVPVPEIIEAGDGHIVYSYVEGTLAVDLLDRLEQPCYEAAVFSAFDGICLWLYDCYAVLDREFSREMILGDAHLRNFICGNEVYGIDFECVAPGRHESDIAALAMFTLTYTPGLTDAKYRLSAFLCGRCIELLQLDAHLLREEMSVQLEIISTRRKTAMPGEVIPELWRRIET